MEKFHSNLSQYVIAFEISNPDVHEVTSDLKIEVSDLNNLCCLINLASNSCYDKTLG